MVFKMQHVMEMKSDNKSMRIPEDSRLIDSMPVSQIISKSIHERRMIRVVAWVEIMGKRAETTFDIESPWVCEGACPELQKESDKAVASWVFNSYSKSGFLLTELSSTNVEVDHMENKKLRTALKDATELFGEIMRDEININAECERWIRAYGQIIK
jgi:hypothetical protein